MFRRTVVALLQLGHALSRVESEALDRKFAHISLLQLGHALSRVERGLTRERYTPASLGFNWATRSRAWKAEIKRAVEWSTG